MNKVVLYSSQPGIEPVVADIDTKCNFFLDINDPLTPSRLCNIGMFFSTRIRDMEWIMSRAAAHFNWYVRHHKLKDSNYSLKEMRRQISNAGGGMPERFL